MQELVIHDKLINFQRLSDAFVPQGPQFLNSRKPERLCRDTGRVSSRLRLQRTHSRSMHQGLALTLSFLIEVLPVALGKGRQGEAREASTQLCSVRR